jgi:Leucine-rich repeat (LRR) protein
MKCYRFVLLTSLFLLPVFFSCQKDDIISTSINGIEVGYQGGEFTISIQATAPWSVVANYNPPTAAERANFQQPVWYQPTASPVADTGWISLNVTEGNAGTYNVVVSVDPYYNHSRCGSVVFKLTDNSQFVVIPVYQLGQKDTDITDKLSDGMKRFFGNETVYFGDVLGIKELFLSGQKYDFMNDLVFFENLEILHCSGCGITSFTTKMPKLRYLECSDNGLTYLDPDLFPELEYLNCSNNPLTSFEILYAPKIWRLYCEGVPIKEFSPGPGLKELSCRRCGLEKLDLSQAVSLGYLDCAYNNLKELDASKTVASTIACFNNNDLSSLVLPEKDGLKNLYAYSCNLSGHLDVHASSIYEVSVSDNRLDKMSFSENAGINTIYCSDNLLKEIILPKAPNKLQEINCKNNLLTELGVVDKSFRRERYNLDGNPGKDGYFTIYVSDNESSYSTEYIVELWQWQWQGQDISVKVVTVPSV